MAAGVVASRSIPVKRYNCKHIRLDLVSALIRSSVRDMLGEIFCVVEKLVKGGTLPVIEPMDADQQLMPHGNDLTQPENPTVSGPVSSTHRTLILQINFIHKGRRLGRPHDTPYDLCPYLHTIAQKALHMGAIAPSNVESLKVKAHLPDGLKEIEDDFMWTSALDKARSTEWMDGCLKIIIEIE